MGVSTTLLPFSRVATLRNRSKAGGAALAGVDLFAPRSLRIRLNRVESLVAGVDSLPEVVIGVFVFDTGGELQSATAEATMESSEES